MDEKGNVEGEVEQSREERRRGCEKHPDVPECS